MISVSATQLVAEPGVYVRPGTYRAKVYGYYGTNGSQTISAVSAQSFTIPTRPLWDVYGLADAREGFAGLTRVRAFGDFAGLNPGLTTHRLIFRQGATEVLAPATVLLTGNTIESGGETMLSAQIPAGLSAGTWMVRARFELGGNNGMQETTELPFEVLQPGEITSLSPAEGFRGGEVTIEGEAFREFDIQVYFIGSDEVEHQAVISEQTSELIRVKVPSDLVQATYRVEVVFLAEEGRRSYAGEYLVKHEREVAGEEIDPLGFTIVAPNGDESFAGTATRTDYELDAKGQLVALYENGNLLMPKFYRTGFGSLSTVDGKRYYELADQLGNVRCVVDESATVVSWSNYYAYGGVRESGGGANSYDNRYKYLAAESDSETNTIHLQAREFDGWLGCFGRIDPLAYQFPHQSPYIYGNANPYLFRDPSGKAAESGDDDDGNLTPYERALKRSYKRFMGAIANFGTYLQNGIKGQAEQTQSAQNQQEQAAQVAATVNAALQPIEPIITGVDNLLAAYYGYEVGLSVGVRLPSELVGDAVSARAVVYGTSHGNIGLKGSFALNYWQTMRIGGDNVPLQQPGAYWSIDVGTGGINSSTANILNHYEKSAFNLPFLGSLSASGSTYDLNVNVGTTGSVGGIVKRKK